MSRIDEKYAELGGEKVLGPPLGPETEIFDGTATFVEYVTGWSIYQTEKTGAHAMSGGIREKWMLLGGGQGPLGYPVSDETDTPGGLGRYVDFQGGSVYWTPQTGAQAVYGTIGQRWRELGGAEGHLGYPLTDEMPTPDGAGRVSLFQGGSITWTAQEGAQVIDRAAGQDDSRIMPAPNVLASIPRDILVGGGHPIAVTLPHDVIDPRNVLGGQDLFRPFRGVDWDFEGLQSGWHAEGSAFAGQPTDAPRQVRPVHIGPPPVPVGGDFWQGGYDIVETTTGGRQGDWWVSSDDAGTGTLTSDPFVLHADRPWFSFLIGGSFDPGRLRVELLIRATEGNRSRFENVREPDGGRVDYSVVTVGDVRYYLLLTAAPQAGDRDEMYRVAVRLGGYDGEEARVRVVDESTTGHINVDDFQFSTQAPPDTWRPLMPNRPAPVWGLADLHAHPMAHLAFGGKLFFGRPDGPIHEALPGCSSAHGLAGLGWGPGSVGNIFFSKFENPNGLGHFVGGYPEFDGWPRFTSRVHQQMYLDWIRRAVDGGLRLMVALAVNNELLAHEFGGRDFDDRTAVQTQIQAIKDFIARHSDFMEIAYTPADARRIIHANKLAVILGVEVDSLGNWRHADSASDDEVRAYIAHLYNDLGVRHIFPIHLANNAFGGTAVYNDTFNVLNRYLRDDYIQVRDASSSGVQFRLGDGEGPVEGWYRISGWYNPPDYRQVPGGHANSLGLTRQGRVAVTEMMRLGMVVDIDHMSEIAVGETLDMAEQHSYPVVAGHCAFRELSWGRAETSDIHRCASEYGRTPSELARVRAVGGVVGVGLHTGDGRDFGGQVANDAAGSAKSWAQGYLYALHHMGGSGVAIGTDMNGLPGSSGPRFGLNACYALDGDDRREPRWRDQVYAQANGVRYDSPIIDYRAHRFEGFAEGEVFDMKERDVWEAIAIHKSGTDPNQAELRPMFGIPARTWWQNNTIKNIAKGFGYTSAEQVEDPFLGGGTRDEQMAAFLVATAQAPPGDASAELHRLHSVIQRIWHRWHAMEGSNPPLTRSHAGRRDFDVNIDGVAHYGMLPDFLQDLRNVGLTQADLAPLFRSAEDYIRAWERCDIAKGRIR